MTVLLSAAVVSHGVNILTNELLYLTPSFQCAPDSYCATKLGYQSYFTLFKE
jgi:hypothetical protein